MPRIAQILAFLQEIGQLSGPASLAAEADVALTGLAADQHAAPGDLAWLSPRLTAEERAARVANFGGSLLLVPAAAGSEGVAVACADPKLAFARAAGAFFAEASEIAWPQVGQAPRAADAQVDPSAALAHGVVIGPGVVIEADARVGPNTVLAHCTLGRGARVGANCSIGLSGFGFATDPEGRRWRFPHVGRVQIAAGVEVGSNTCIDRGSLGDTVLEAGAKIDNLVHVAHNVRVGAEALVIADAMLGGSVTVGAGAWIAPSAAVINQRTIGAGATVGLGAVVIRDVLPGQTVVGNPARPLEGRA